MSLTSFRATSLAVLPRSDLDLHPRLVTERLPCPVHLIRRTGIAGKTTAAHIGRRSRFLMGSCDPWPGGRCRLLPGTPASSSSCSSRPAVAVRPFPGGGSPPEGTRLPGAGHFSSCLAHTRPRSGFPIAHRGGPVGIVLPLAHQGDACGCRVAWHGGDGWSGSFNCPAVITDHAGGSRSGVPRSGHCRRSR
jgi:hypothetical protein